MDEKSHLRDMILKHWQAHRPQMVEDLRKSCQLEQAISEAEVRTVDLLHELLALRKMQYQDAWEMATQEWAFLPTVVPH